MTELDSDNHLFIHVLARAVIVQHDHILLAYDPRPKPMHYYQLNQPFYYLPGGHIEFQEAAEAAVVREVLEETGYAAADPKFLGCIEHAWQFEGDHVCCHTHEINLIFKTIIADLHYPHLPQQQEEHVSLAWIALNDLSTIDLRPDPLKKLIPLWLKGQLEASTAATFLSHMPDK